MHDETRPCGIDLAAGRVRCAVSIIGEIDNVDTTPIHRRRIFLDDGLQRRLHLTKIQVAIVLGQELHSLGRVRIRRVGIRLPKPNHTGRRVGVLGPDPLVDRTQVARALAEVSCRLRAGTGPVAEADFTVRGNIAQNRGYRGLGCWREAACGSIRKCDVSARKTKVSRCKCSSGSKGGESEDQGRMHC